MIELERLIDDQLADDASDFVDYREPRPAREIVVDPARLEGLTANMQAKHTAGIVSWGMPAKILSAKETRTCNCNAKKGLQGLDYAQFPTSRATHKVTGRDYISKVLNIKTKYILSIYQLIQLALNPACRVIGGGGIKFKQYCMLGKVEGKRITTKQTTYAFDIDEEMAICWDCDFAY